MPDNMLKENALVSDPVVQVAGIIWRILKPRLEAPNIPANSATMWALLILAPTSCRPMKVARSTSPQRQNMMHKSAPTDRSNKSVIAAVTNDGVRLSITFSLFCAGFAFLLARVDRFCNILLHSHSPQLRECPLTK